MFRRALTFLLLLLPSIICTAQNSVFYGKENGLSSTLIRFLYEDRDGMIWVATENGLNRFDGSRFVRYYHNPEDPRSIASNFVNSLFEDSKGRLFVCTHSGVQLYDPLTDSFSELALLDGEPSGQVSVVAERSGGELWAVGNRVALLHVDGNQLSMSLLTSDSSLGFADYAMEDKDFNFWVVKHNRGVYRASPDGRVSSYLTDGNYSLLGISESISGDVVVISGTCGVLRYDSVEDDFVQVSQGGSLSGGRCFSQISPGFALVGSDNGVKILNLRSGNSRDYMPRDGQVDLRKYKIVSMCRDLGGNLWIGAYQKGLFMIPAQWNNFRYIGHKSLSADIIGDNVVTSMLRLPDGRMFLGTDNDGIYALSPDNSSSRHYAPGTGIHGVPDGISAMFLDSRGTLWVGAFGGGIAIFDPETGRCVPFAHPVAGESVSTVSGFAEDNDGNLWISTMGSGLYSINLDTGAVIDISSYNHEIPLYITSLAFASDGNLYIGSYDGGCMLDLDDGFKFFSISDDNIVYCVKELRDGSIAFGCDNGLMLWSAVMGKRLKTGVGNVSNEVYSILQDDEGFTWIATGQGLSRLSRDYEVMAFYYPEDGIGSGEFNKNVCWEDDGDGSLWFGGLDGVTYFRPREIMSPSKKWTVRITSLYLHNHPVTGGMKSGRYEILDAPVYKADEINLFCKDNSFTLLFSTLEHNSPDRLQFMYRIDGGDWIHLPQGLRRVSFSGLSSERHFLELKARDNRVESDTIGLTINVHPSFWASPFAKTMYVIALLAMAVMFFVWERRHYLAKQQIREYRHAEQINNFKLQFFVDIYHELKSPLSMIINPLKKLMSTDDDPSRQRNYRIMYRNSERILNLMNQLLDLRRIDTGGLQLAFNKVDLVKYLSAIVESYSEQYSIKNITLQFVHPGLDSLESWIDPDNFDKIIYNLLSNAYKFTPENGEVTLSLGKEGNGEDAKARIVVSDNGIGIKPGELETIFNRFYQSKDGQSVYKGGAGIGLDLTRALVELHHGQIHAENNSGGKGASFIVTVPLVQPDKDPRTVPAAPESPGNDPVSPRAGLIPDSVDADNSLALNPKTRIKVLLVDDDNDLRCYLAAELSSFFRIIEAANGAEAFNTALSVKPDIIVSDVMMPVMNGMELCSKVKHNININHIPVVLLSCKSEETDTVEGLKTGADAYLPKPVSTDLLKTTILNLVQSRRMLRNNFSGQQNLNEKLSVPEIDSPDDKLMSRIMKALEANMSDPGLTIEKLASEIGISRVHLHRKLKELTNQTTSDFIRNTRLSRAARILSEGKQSISEVAALVGFDNQANFATAFKRMYGVTPREYMKNNGMAEPEQSQDTK